jgi:hypothetical protein
MHPTRHADWKVAGRFANMVRLLRSEYLRAEPKRLKRGAAGNPAGTPSQS